MALVGAMALPYPDRFYAAAAYAGFTESSPAISPTKRPILGLSDDSALLLYALYKQATQGPCKLPKPWSWNVVELAKWTSWKHLGTMDSMEAMRLFIRTLEEVDASWWSKSQDQVEEISLSVPNKAAIPEPASETGEANPLQIVEKMPKLKLPSIPNGSLSINGDAHKCGIVANVTEGLEAITSYNEWVPLKVTGRRPPARYQHAATIVEGKLYVIGGNHNGRYLNDVHVLDLKKLEWSKADTKIPQSPLSSHHELLQSWFPPCAGHSLVRWGRKLLSVAGHSKETSATVTVHAFDTHSSSFTKLEVFGQAPIARGLQSVTLVGSQLYMFGGEDTKRRLLNDLNILDLETLTWETVVASGACPSPRSGHTAAAHGNRYIFIFGGHSLSSCYNDLHALDLENMEWSQIQMQGTDPMPRAGHAGVTLFDNWYITGGGDHTSGISETLVLNMTTLVWSVHKHTAITCEGLSLAATRDSLLAFGGYDGSFSNEVYVYKLSPGMDSLEKFLEFSPPPAATLVSSDTALQSLGVSGSTPALQELSETRVLDPATITPPEELRRVTEEDLPTNKKVEAGREVNPELRPATSTDEVAKLQKENAAALSSLLDFEHELDSVRGQLQAEQSMSFRLEVEVAELRQKLSSMEVLQKELDILQRQKVMSDKAAAEAAQKESTGVWSWLAGTPAGPRVD